MKYKHNPCLEAICNYKITPSSPTLCSYILGDATVEGQVHPCMAWLCYLIDGRFFNQSRSI